MSPEERLEALRDDARWQPVRLYPEHGRMPAPVRPRPWWVLVGAGVVLVVVALVFTGVVWGRSLGNQTAPMIAGTPMVTRNPEPAPAATSSAEELLAKAVLPPQAVAGRADSVGTTLPNSGELCGMLSIGASFWTVPGMSVDDAISWLDANRPNGMVAGTFLRNDLGAAATMQSGAVFDVAGDSSRQGLLFSVVSPPGFGTTIRVDAVSLPQTAACVIAHLQEVTTGPEPSDSAASQAERDAEAAAARAAAAAQRSATATPATGAR
jgi:hypothetical protein